MRELNPVAWRILDRTLYLIGQHGTVDVPIRAIIKEANVNLGAINYYFETKEQMLSLVREFYTENIIKTMRYLEDTTKTAEDRLLGYATETMDYTLKYPNAVVLVKDAMRKRSQDPVSRSLLETLKNLFDILNQTLMECLGEEHFEIKKMIFMSAMVHPTEENVDDGYYIRNVDTEEKRRYFINSLMKMLKNFEG